MAEAIRGTIFGAITSGPAVPQSGVSVTVYKAGTSTLASLYSDDALTASVANPMTSEADGSYFAFAPNGKYDIVFSKAGVTFDSTDSVGEVLWDEQIVKTTSATSYTLTDIDYILLVDATAAAVTVNLPALSGVQAGRPWIIIKIDSSANTVTLDPSGAETINGAVTLVISASKQGVTIRKGSTEWQTDMPPASVTPGSGKIPQGRSSDGRLTPDWLLVPLKEVDGSGSGLDADTVDTFHASQTPTANQIPVLAGNSVVTFPSTVVGTSPNQSSTGGLIVQADPSATPAYLQFTNNGRVNEWAAISVTAAGVVNIASAGALQKSGNLIWHAGNDGSGSGLDADTVDTKNPGSASGIATLDANTRLVEPANTIYDSVGNRSASPNYSPNVVPIRDVEGSLLFKPATLMVVPLGISLDWATVTVVGTGTQSLRGMFLRHATSAATNDLVATWNTSTPFMPVDFFSAPYPMNIEWTVILPDVTNSMYHCRLSAVNTDPSAADTHDHVGFKIINQAVYATNGNGTTGNATDTTILAISPGINRLRIAITSTAIRYYVNGVLGATHTTNLPAYTNTGNYFIVQTKTTTTALRIAHWQRFLYEKGM